MKKWKKLLETSFYSCVPKSQSYKNDVRFLRYGVRLTEVFVIFGHFLPFYPPNDPENQNFEKNDKNAWRYYPFTHAYHKWRYDAWLLKYKLGDKIFCHIEPFFALSPPWQPENKKKNTWRYYHFTHVHHKWQSYDKWFLRYGASQTELFFIFCPFTPLTTEKIKTFEKWRKTLEISFYKCVP